VVKNYGAKMKKIICVLSVLCLLSSACYTEKKKDRIETGGVTIDETAELSEKDIFFKKKLFPELRRQNYAGAQQLIDTETEKHPEYQKEPLFFTARSLINFHKGNYEDAYMDSTKVIEIMEQRFAPKKPWQTEFQSENARNSVASHYLYRYQALMKLGRYNEALSDVEKALKIHEKPRLLLIKGMLQLKLKQYEDAAAVINRAFVLDPEVLKREGESSGMNLCTVFYEHGYMKVKACADYFKIIDEKKEEANEA
jgi:tetratricopeptide (TPR) repeat protein